MSSSTIVHFNVHEADFTPLEGLNGAEAILYQSPDGTRIAGSFRESGTHTMTQDFDEFIYVIAGTARVTVDGTAPVDLSAGHCCYLRQGAQVTFVMSEDFHDVAVLMSDSRISY